MYPVNAGTNDACQLTTPDCWKELRRRFRIKESGLPQNSSLLDFLCENGCVDFSKSLSSSSRQDNDMVIHDLSLPRELPHRKENSYQGPMFGLKHRPGFIHCPQALGESLQRKLAFLCMTKYCKKPHVTNVDSHRHRPVSKQPKLAWASLGFNFDWTKRKYFNHARSPFPSELEELTAFFARATQEHDNGYVAQTAIVNFYDAGGNMGAHVDDSEDDISNPVISLNLGATCVFLVGTADRHEKPIPVLVRAGDVTILSGQSRLCYHGVATIFPKHVPIPLPLGFEMENHLQVKTLPHISESDLTLSEKQEEEVDTYLLNHRINLNVRQVLIDGETKLRAED